MQVVDREQTTDDVKSSLFYNHYRGLYGTVQKAYEATGEVAVTVADDGIGLPQADRGRLTEPYVTHKPKGTGLGLAIVKKIMEDHGGRVTLEDRADGPGAVATLILPLRINEPPTTSGRDADAA